MSQKKVLIVVGTRPNFIKITRFKEIAQKKYPTIDIKIVHTGQHYDYEMAEVFFQQLKVAPDFFLETPSAQPATQMGNIMIKLEQLIDQQYSPDIMIVPGDVNSTLAAALVANKKGITLAHLESGLRSFDNEMPEEINRILTDSISDHFFVTEQSGIDNIQNENLKGTVHFVGNTMIDTLVNFENEIENSQILQELNLEKKSFILMTIHRPSNVDQYEGLMNLKKLINEIGEDYKVVFPVHHRTMKSIENHQLKEAFEQLPNLIITKALGYFDFQKLILSSKMIITDSGGIQEESTYRQVPCVTLRNNTERPITTTIGTNVLSTFSVSSIKSYLDKVSTGQFKSGEIPPKWDGNATERILAVIDKII